MIRPDKGDNIKYAANHKGDNIKYDAARQGGQYKVCGKPRGTRNDPKVNRTERAWT